jgi:hypothetical protein
MLLIRKDKRSEATPMGRTNLCVEDMAGAPVRRSCFLNVDYQALRRCVDLLKLVRSNKIDLSLFVRNPHSCANFAVIVC